MSSSVHEAEPLATDVQIDNQSLTVRIADGYAIEWADVDEHIGIDGLLAGRRSGESAESLGRWLASRTK